MFSVVLCYYSSVGKFLEMLARNKPKLLGNHSVSVTLPLYQLLLLHSVLLKEKKNTLGTND